MFLSSKNKTNILISIVMLVLGAGTTLVYSSISFLTKLVEIEENLSWLIIADYAIGMIITTFVIGKIVDGLEKRIVVIVSLFVLCIGDLLIAFGGMRTLVVIGIALSGLGFSSSESVSSAYLIDQNNGNATKWVNLSQIFFCVGAVLTPFLTAYLKNERSIPNTMFFIVISILALILGLTISKMGIKESCKSSYIIEKKINLDKAFNQFSLLKNQRFRILCIESFLYLCIETMGSSYLKILMMNYSFTETQSSIATSIFWALMICGRLVGCTQSGKENKSISVFSIITIIGCVMLSTATKYHVLLFSAAILGFGCGPVWSMIFVLGSQEFPQKSGAAFTVMMMFTDISIMLSPAIFVGLVDNLNITFIMCAISSLLILILNQQFFVRKC